MKYYIGVDGGGTKTAFAHESPGSAKFPTMGYSPYPGVPSTPT